MVSSRVTGSNENISSFGASGFGRDYTTLSTWESATDNDLVTGALSEVLELYFDQAIFTANTSISGATTNSSFFRILRAAAHHGHDGTPNRGVRINRTSGSVTIDIAENNASVQDLIVTHNGNTAGATRAIRLLNSTNIRVIGCIVGPSTNAGLGATNGIGFSNGDNAIVANCTVIDVDGDGIFVNSTSAGVTLYNNTVVNAGMEGYDIDESTTLVKNCLSDNATLFDFSGTVASGSTTNASSDTTAPGTSPRTSQTFTFEDAANDNYHLDSSDTGALGFGTDLSGDATFGFDDDVDDRTIDTWAIGSDSENEAFVLADRVSHHFKMEDAGNESNEAATPMEPLSLTASATAPEVVSGQVGDARSFEDINRNLLAASPFVTIRPGEGPINASIAVWVNFDSLTGSALGRREQSWIMEGSAAADNTRRFVCFADGTTDRAALLVNQSSQVAVEVQGTTFGILSTGTWYLVVCLLDGNAGTIGISVNNSAIDTTAWDGTMYTGSTSNTAVAVANSLASYDPRADIDELLVWNRRVLTTADITELWNSGSGTPVGGGGGGGGFIPIIRRRRRTR
jgi:hypothetical protein